jgi:kynurenine formamidase
MKRLVDLAHIVEAGMETYPGLPGPVIRDFPNLAALPAAGARLHPAPVKVKAFGTFPVRAYAVV